jgi:hypothetical protein
LARPMDEKLRRLAERQAKSPASEEGAIATGGEGVPLSAP